MPYALSRGSRLYYEEWGRGTPIVFVHEFSGDLYSWEAQLRRFSRRHRCIAFNARGYPPSDVPRSAAHYSYRIAVEDIANVMRHVGERTAHVIGCSMGAYTTLQFGLRYPRMARSLTLVGVGAGSDLAKLEQFHRDTEAQAQAYLALGTREVVKMYWNHPARVPLPRSPVDAATPDGPRVTLRLGRGVPGTIVAPTPPEAPRRRGWLRRLFSRG